ncbi:LytTR family DNA-binding domain-containing protein [uncultured Psychrobacter sp.]|mgnify:CR=1 FL=1|jgi:two-component system response regulator AlgR|uniref:LytR/AlgR family response regulator transcription factor n=1 Tax=uncultured Psychrobacter sp. TaxID=259303 RepID=UPI00260C58F3|nr:LytTR family DNA-binding domain-containing protein [uncultured Psychrobacter sp.]|tara:strand:+ start:1844 stop:2581 length:738 start_codon:yes stop_codon:yes gene_type:complete
MRIVVCDDEPLARERLVRIVKQSGHEVVAQVGTGAEAVDAVKLHQPELILLDIRMPEMDGVRCAQILGELEHPPAIIFVTAYDHYAIAAFKANAIGYLLKPANKDELIDALSKASNLNAAQLDGIRKLEDPMSRPPREHIAARTHRGVELINISDIYYFTADQKYVKVRHTDGIVLIDETLKELEEEFDDRLFRVHRNAIINLDFLDFLETIEGGRYQVRFKGTDETLAVSRRHLPALREKIQSM